MNVFTTMNTASVTTWYMTMRKVSFCFRISTEAFMAVDMNIYSPRAMVQRIRILGASVVVTRKRPPNQANVWKRAAIVKGTHGNVETGRMRV